MFTDFITVMLAATLALFVFTRLAAERLIRHHRAQKMDFFRRYPVERGDIVFLGDSITDGARWHELFPKQPVKNRGINADTVSGVLERLDEILPARPAAIFILIGTNDLPWYTYHSDRHILSAYQAILERCRDESPETRVFVQAILPRRRRYARRIQALNLRLKELAERCGCTYVHLFPHFAGESGAIRSELSNDHLHLMASGYGIWVDLLSPYVENLAAQENVHQP